jgi:UDP-3-O-[3-hydroxymyristoyl] glucosamine N-acyltransferase
MRVLLKQLAELIGGVLLGDASLEIAGAANIASATNGEITFVNNPKRWQEFLDSEATAAIVSGVENPQGKPCIQVVDAEHSFASVVSFFRPPVNRKRIGISPDAKVSTTATIDAGADVYPGAFVGDGVSIGSGSRIMPGVCILENCRIGCNVTIFPNAVLYEGTVVGDRSIIHAGVVLGAYGFGYRTRDGKHELSAQLGSVVIGEDVELGANTTIDRGTFGPTTVGDGTKMDNQVMIGHNCQIGKHNLLCSQVGIAGSSATGDYVVMAGQVGIGDHLKIGERAILCAKAGVMHEIPAGQTFLGIPATPIREQMQILACTQKLPEMRSQVKDLTRQIEKLRIELGDKPVPKAA